MKLKFVTLTVLILLVTTRVFSQDYTLVVSKGHYYLLLPSESGEVVLHRIGNVVTLGGPITPPKEDPETTEFNLVSQAKGWMDSVPAEAKKDAEQIRKVLADSASAARDGKFKTLAEMETALGVALSQTIQNKIAWSTFGTALQTAIHNFQTSGMITTPADLGRALQEVAKGME